MKAIISIFNGVVSYLLRGIIVATLLLCCMPGVAHANYTTACVTPVDVSVSPANIIINSGDSSQYPVGTLIGGPYSDAKSVLLFTGQVCSVGGGSSSWAESGKASVGSYSSPEGILPVYPLDGVSGFGYAMSVADPNEPWQALQQNPTTALYSVTYPYGLNQGGLGMRYKLYLVTTAPLVPGNHVVAGGESMEKTCISSSRTSNTRDVCSTLSNNSFTISVKTTGCDIDNNLTPASVFLRPINANALPHQGDTGVDVYFAISLKCDPSTTVNLTLTDPNGGDQDNGVLYNDTGSGLAENVGVQLLLRKDGGSMQPTQLNKSITVGQSGSEEQYDIPMAARYYRTSDSTIVGGKVSASVIYELSYQ